MLNTSLKNPDKTIDQIPKKKKLKNVPTWWNFNDGTTKKCCKTLKYDFFELRKAILIKIWGVKLETDSFWNLHFFCHTSSGTMFSSSWLDQKYSFQSGNQIFLLGIDFFKLRRAILTKIWGMKVEIDCFWNLPIFLLFLLRNHVFQVRIGSEI